MKLSKSCALLVIDIQQDDFMEMNENNMGDPRWSVIRNSKRVLDVFRKKSCRLFKSKNVTAQTWWTSGANWTALRIFTAWKTARKTTMLN